MNKLILILCLVVLATPALCDGTATLISWPGWVCSSSEDLSLGHRHTSFPLTYLFDNDPATPWVFSGTGKHAESGRTGFAIDLAREEGRKPISADSVWIMNGYNKSPELFARNNRITELKLYVNWKLVKTVTLADSMGWRKMSIPRRPIKEIALRFTKFEKGRDDDVCVSEIALYDRGNRVDLRMPKVVEFTEGNVDCGCGQQWQMIDRRGKKLFDYDYDGLPQWSPSGRYVAGVEADKLWVVDSSTGKITMRRALSADKAYSRVDSWDGDRSVDVSMDKYTPQKSAPGGYRTESYTKTIRIIGR